MSPTRAAHSWTIDARFTTMHGSGHHRDTHREVDGAWRIAGADLTRLRLESTD